MSMYTYLYAYSCVVVYVYEYIAGMVIVCLLAIAAMEDLFKLANTLQVMRFYFILCLRRYL